MVRDWTSFHGESIRRGVYPLELPFAWLLDWIYTWATYQAKPDQKAEFDAKLHQPPASATIRDDDEVWGRDALLNQFMGAMATMGARPGRRSR